MEMEGFCIREYASRVRGVDVVKCWPFHESTDQKTIKSLLPPISIKKFSWWGDELSSLHPKSEGKNVENLKMKKKKKKRALKKNETDVERRVGLGKVKLVKGKAKAPRKRSIIELFAVAPQVERAFSSDEDDEEEIADGSSLFSFHSFHEEINWGLKGKRNENKKMNKIKDPIFATKLIKKNLKKRRKKKKKAYNDLDFSGPEFKLSQDNHSNKKVQTQEKGIGKANPLFNTELENQEADCVSGKKRKSRLQFLDFNKRLTTGCKILNLIPKNEKPVWGQGGLMNHNKEFSLPQLRECFTLKTGHCGNKKAAGPLSCSENEYVDGRGTKLSHSQETICDVIGSGQRSNVPKDCESKYICNRTEKEQVVGRVVEEQSTISCCIVDPLMKQAEKVETFTELVPPDRFVRHAVDGQKFDDRLREAAPDQMYALPPGLVSLPVEGNYDVPTIKVTRDSSNSVCRRLVKDKGTSDPRFAQVHFGDCLKACQKFQWDKNSHSYDLDKRADIIAQPVDKSQFFVGQTFPHLSSAPLPSNVWSLPTGNSFGCVYGEKCTNGINEIIFGLPLNSNGELMTLHSNSKSEFDQMPKSSCMAAPSTILSPTDCAISKSFVNHASTDYGSFSNGWLDHFPLERCMKENPSVVTPSSIDVTGFQNNGERNPDLNSERIYDHFFPLGKQKGKEQNYIHGGSEIDKIQSRMRLMGKEFMVSGMGIQGPENGRVWNDKQIPEELYFHKSSLMTNKWSKPGLRKHGETLFHPSEIPVYRRSGTPKASEDQSHVFQNDRSILTASSNNLRLVQMGNNKIPPPASSSASIKCPSTQTDFRGHNQSAHCLRFSQNLSSLLDISMRQSRFNLDSSHHPCLIPTTNQWDASSTSVRPQGFCVYTPLRKVQTSVCPPVTAYPLTQHPVPMAFLSEPLSISSLRGADLIEHDHGRIAMMQDSSDPNFVFQRSKRFQEASQSAITQLDSSECYHLADFWDKTYTRALSTKESPEWPIPLCPTTAGFRF